MSQAEGKPTCKWRRDLGRLADGKEVWKSTLSRWYCMINVYRAEAYCLNETHGSRNGRKSDSKNGSYRGIYFKLQATKPSEDRVVT